MLLLILYFCLSCLSRQSIESFPRLISLCFLSIMVVQHQTGSSQTYLLGSKERYVRLFKMMSYLLEWVKLLYFLNTFCFPAPSRSHLQLCFCGNVAYFIKQTNKKRVAFSFVAYTWASGVLVCLNSIHAIQGSL